MKQSYGTTFFESVLNEQQVVPIFELFKANTVRLRSPFSMVFVTIYDEQTIDEQMDIEKIETFLHSKIRKTDIIFSVSNELTWGILLAQGSDKEANAFIHRVFNDSINELPTYISLVASVAVIANDDHAFEEIYNDCVEALHVAKQKDPWHVQHITSYSDKKIEIIKVSIIEPNKIVQNIIKMSLDHFKVRDYELEIKTFQDGYDFLQSEWYLSGHRHFIIMNDILPRKNGFEVLNVLRSLPNDKRFIIFMMSMKNAENDTIVAYENGVDHYLIKPFNIRLFEAQFKRTMERLK